jgi:hypothetical protein
MVNSNGETHCSDVAKGCRGEDYFHFEASITERQSNVPWVRQARVLVESKSPEQKHCISLKEHRVYLVRGSIGICALRRFNLI